MSVPGTSVSSTFKMRVALILVRIAFETSVTHSSKIALILNFWENEVISCSMSAPVEYLFQFSPRILVSSNLFFMDMSQIKDDKPESMRLTDFGILIDSLWV